MREQWESLELLLANSGNSHTLTSTNAIEDADQGHRIKMPDIDPSPRT